MDEWSTVNLTDQNDLLAMAIAAAFSAGLNVYATVATLGLLAYTGVLQLPPSLHVLQSLPVIVASIVLFVGEFIADKIPGFDLLWNALHTFVRIPAAALLAFGATAQMSPVTQIVAAGLGAGVALASHGGKIAIRAAVTPSPEPFSNASLSFAEDVVAIGLTWFATTYPWIAISVTIAFLVAIVLVVRRIIRAMRRLFAGARRQWEAVANSW